MVKQDGNNLIFQKGGNLASVVMGTVVFLLPGAFAIYAAMTISAKPNVLGLLFGAAMFLAGLYALVSLQRVTISEQQIMRTKRGFLGQTSTIYEFKDLKKVEITHHRRHRNGSTTHIYLLSLHFADGEVAKVLEFMDLEAVRKVAKAVVDRVDAEFSETVD